MPVKVGVNGFGRIGRMALRAAVQHFEDIEVVSVNDLHEADRLAYLLRYDSVHGRFGTDVAVQGRDLLVDGRRIHVTAVEDPANLCWNDLGADVVLECTGRFLSTERAGRHLAAGARRVIISAAPEDGSPMFVFGVNDDAYAGQAVISNASCTTNCLAVVAKVLHDAWGIRRGLLSVVHAATGSQRAVDSLESEDWRGGRGVIDNIIPFPTRATESLGAVVPALAGRLSGTSFRVPTRSVSVIDLNVELTRAATYRQVCAAMRSASEGALKGVLGYTEDKIVAADVRGSPCTAIFDASSGVAADGTLVKVVAWFDNEWAYANKLLEMARVVAR